jgi:galactokinase
VVWSLRLSGVDIPGAEIAVASDVPIRAGLSSSAALECATVGALLDLAPPPHPPVSTWPGLAQLAENGYVGMPCGMMDQSASIRRR